MSKFKARQYCIAFNCLNSDRDRTLSFFTLPKDLERRRQWLTLIGRQDLMEKEKEQYCGKVCSAHFDENTFKLIRQLKADALPTKLLPDPAEGMSCVTNKEDHGGVATGTQTEMLKRKDPLKIEEAKKRKEEKADGTVIKKEGVAKTENTVEIEIEFSSEASLECEEIINYD